MSWVIILLYCLSLSYIFFYSLGQLHLTFHYLKSKKSNKVELNNSFDQEWPFVTVQLPVYNEKYVVQRLLENIARLEYPSDRIEIQVLDDSTDETTEIIQETISSLKKKNFIHIRRPDRSAFKAGALKYGLETAKGEFIAIFDSDFMPKNDFLLKTIPVFQENTGVVQTRWGHLNRDYSVLTRLQAFGLDAHFSVEQTGRSHAGSFINFNGTGGVWRKRCILDSGGWSADTLTEDLDLSYRAQLKGWKFKYLENCIAPAELPVIMPAIKSQQYRWNKGAAETARKNLSSVLKSNIDFKNKIHAFFHLLNSSVFVSLLLAAFLSIPMLYIKDANPSLNFIFNIGSIFLLGFFSISFFYWVASRSIREKGTFTYYLKNFPAFLVVSMGLSLHNGLAVLEGLTGRKTPFVRTPKFNSTEKASNWKSNAYIKWKLTPVTLLEGFLSVYFIFGIYSAFLLKDWGLIIFHIMLAAGFLFVFIHSVGFKKYGS